MSYDDTKDKLRRNLVAFCSIYLASGFLKVQEGISIFSALMKSGVSLEPWRVHFVTFVVLLYLSFRWFTSEEQINLFRGIASSFRTDLRSSILKIAIPDPTGIGRPTWTTTDENGYRALQSRAERAEESRAQYGHLRTPIEVSFRPSKWLRTGEITYSLQLPEEGNHPVVNWNYDMPRRKYIRIFLRVFLMRIFLFSTWEWFTPVMVVLVASLYCAVRFAMVLF